MNSDNLPQLNGTKPLLPLIYCEKCEQAQPYIRDFLPADELNCHDAEDIVCDVCKLVIATFHEKVD